jgi:murein DD-endopeptidase MepM/ murein hydrolase activator NlpD
MLAWVLAALQALAAGSAGEVAHARVAVHPLATPRPAVTTDGALHVGYELLITNYHADTGSLSLRRVEVAAGPGRDPLLALEDDALASRIVHPGRRPGAAVDAREIEAGEHVVLFLWVRLPPGEPPRQLHHTLRFRAQTGRERAVDAFAVALAEPTRLTLGAPFRAGRWLVHEGPGRHASHHWRSQLAGNGRVTIPQRFAIDFLGLDAQGRAVRRAAKGSANEDWIGFGAEVLAVGDGLVRDARDGVADRAPLAVSGPPASTTARGLYGNFVVLETGGVFVHYAHLQHGSLQVRPGQRVRRGDVIGRLGNSGNTTGPHLHLHVSDRVTFEEAEGLPYLFRDVHVLGETSADRALDLEEPAAAFAAAGARRRGLPLHGTVVHFGVPIDRPRSER